MVAARATVPSMVRLLFLLLAVAEAALRGQSSSHAHHSEIPLALDSQTLPSNLRNAGRHVAHFLHDKFASFASQLRSRSPRQMAALQETHGQAADAKLGRGRLELNHTSVELDGLSLLQEEVHLTVAPPQPVGSPDMMISDAEVIRQDARVSTYPPPWMGVLSVALLGGLAAKVLFLRLSDERRSLQDEKCHPDESDATAVPADAQATKSQPVEPGGEEALLSEIRQLAVQSGDDILPPRKSYDCLFAQPQEDLVCCRLVGRVKATTAATLQSPVSGQDCVLYSASAVELRMDGVHALPVAFDAVTLDFALELPGSKGETEVHICGKDVALFAQEAGRHHRRMALKDAEESLQSFVRTHRVGCAIGSPLCASTPDGARATMNFSESCLPVGSLVCCVGKLHRSMTGRLELLPCDLSYMGAVSNLQQQERILISDNASLLAANA
mmetsp:Transcript_13135/g.24203  ORF Transcript_13135/g.24203 Transcript_13135/m.24203 type:complete len:443 (+) Transcript_13135:169-1497(+)